MKKLILALSAMAMLTSGTLAACATPGELAHAPSVSSLDGEGHIVLAPSRKISVKLNAGGDPVFVREGPHPTSELTFGPTPAPQPNWGEVDVASLPAVERNVVSFYLWSDDKRGTLLVMTNGGPSNLVYLANIVERKEGKLVSTPTTICAVRPGRPGGEIWPFAVVAIEITEILAVPTPVCVDTQSRDTYYPGQQPPTGGKPLARPKGAIAS